MLIAEPDMSAYTPPVPRSLGDLGIPTTLVTDLVLRRAQMQGTCSLFSLCEALKLSHGIVEAVFRQMQQQQLLEIRGMVGEDYYFVLTNAGQRVATNRRRLCHYAGPTPVSLSDYERTVRAQVVHPRLNRKSLLQEFSDLVVSDALIEEIGPAVVSQTSLFLYGPTGNGKTSVAERLHRVYKDFVFLPYAVEVDGQVIAVLDPVVHTRVEIEGSLKYDPRYVPCRRPYIAVGGELTSTMLELRLDPTSQIYAAPLQMKANNGVLVIDDFGRQVVSPRKLLNRWIVPLDRRVDYLSLSYGVKFQIPFELMVVFSTNLDPRDLADEAFLRRIQNKVYIGSIDDEVFDTIFERCARHYAVRIGPDAPAYARKLCRAAGCSELRACYPGDICRIARSITQFEERPADIANRELERAVALYFTRKIGAGGLPPERF